MTKEKLKKFKRIFEKQREQIAKKGGGIIREDFLINPDDRLDEIDQAATDMDKEMRMRLCNRETLYLKKVDEALRRIEDGNFGECEECGEDIEFRRLEARPTATHCVSCKEEQERKEGLTAAGRQHKSLGQSFSRRTA